MPALTSLWRTLPPLNTRFKPMVVVKTLKNNEEGYKKHYAGDSKEISLSLWVIIYMKLIDTQKSKSKKKDAMLLSAFNLAMDRPRRVIRW